MKTSAVKFSLKNRQIALVELGIQESKKSQLQNRKSMDQNNILENFGDLDLFGDFETFVGSLILGVGFFLSFFLGVQFRTPIGIRIHQIMFKLLVILILILLSIQVRTHNMFSQILSFQILTLLGPVSIKINTCQLILTTLDPP